LRKEDLSIIVVDDLQFSREVVKSGLSKSGFMDIRTAASADEALYLLNQRRAHVVLADFWMPGMNGLEMTDLIRRWDENNDRYTGIVLLTAEDTASSIVVAFDRGVDDFISKSANQFELAARVFGAGRNAFQQNALRERMRRVSSQFLRVKQYNLQDPETNLPNRAQLELHIESLIEHCQARGGGIGVGNLEDNRQFDPAVAAADGHGGALQPQYLCRIGALPRSPGFQSGPVPSPDSKHQTSHDADHRPGQADANRNWSLARP
jgi:PleD family two-component response regulator